MQPPASFQTLLEQAQSARLGGQLERAGQLLDQAQPLQPGEPALAAERAHLLYTQGQYQQAFQLLRAAIAAQPGQPDYYLLLGNIFRETGHPAEARDAFGACLELNPNHVTALLCLGNLARDQRQTRDARLLYERALRLKPGDPHIQSNLAMVLCDAGNTAEAVRLLEASLQTHPAALTHSNLLLTLHYDSSVTPERLAREHRKWAAVHAKDIRRLSVRNDFNPDRKLRLGFVSADFKNHPVGRFMAALWPHLDRQRFEVAAYDAGTRRDSMNEKLRSLAAPWRSLQGLDDDAAAELIHRDAVDVLFDLSGHTAGNRLLVFARKPAPMQVTWFAYPNTTGLEAVDWRITDELSEPRGAASLPGAEKPLYLPETAWLYRAPEEELPLRPLPFTRGEPFTFGCLNNPAKASDASLAAWAAILAQAPESRLVLLVRHDADYQEQLRQRFRRAGAREAQVCFVLPGPPKEFYEHHYKMDLMLDPFPYNGAVTTADALWMGVPVLSLAGDTYVSRQGVCLLTQLGLEELLCANADDYVRKAVACAAAPQALAALAPTLRDKLRRSPFLNYPRFAQAFSVALRSAWQQTCAEQSRRQGQRGRLR